MDTLPFEEQRPATKAPILGRVRRMRLRPHKPERFASYVVLVIVLSAIAYGWTQRHETWLDPEDGIGYWLGIIGGSMMLILLIYPLRKRSSSTRALGTVGFWFRFHMLLGLFGPLAILYHSRFTWGALNSAMALWAMIIVASSGLIGRFLYAHVHRGYSARKLEMREMKAEMDGLLDDLEAEGGDEIDPALLHRYEDDAIAASKSFWSGARAVLVLGVRTRVDQYRMIRRIKHSSPEHEHAMRQGLDDFFIAVRRASEFAFYNRLLRLWHYFHLPLFIMLVCAAILHIVAVHQY